MVESKEGSNAAPSAAETTEPAEASSLERVLHLVDDRVGPSVGALHAAFVQAVSGRNATVLLLGSQHNLTATIADHVDHRLVHEAVTKKTLALLQSNEGRSSIIGFLQTQIPDSTVIRAHTIEIEADQQLTLRSGRAAIQLRSDGAIEMLGTRIAATSRGVFRLIGRALRLN